MNQILRSDWLSCPLGIATVFLQERFSLTPAHQGFRFSFFLSKESENKKADSLEENDEFREQLITNSFGHMMSPLLTKLAWSFQQS